MIKPIDTKIPLSKAKPTKKDKKSVDFKPHKTSKIKDTYAPSLKYISQKSLQKDEYLLYDGYDSSRDITGIEVSEGDLTQPYKIKLKLAFLKEGAEDKFLDLYLLISYKQTGQTYIPDFLPAISEKPWNIALNIYNNNYHTALDENFLQHPGTIKTVNFDYARNCVDIELEKGILRQLGWKDKTPLYINALTTKPFEGKITDTLGDPLSKPWVNDGIIKDGMNTNEPKNLEPSKTTITHEDSIYFLITDRFADGDPNNSADTNKKDPFAFHSGDLKGVINNLDYINQFATTIWTTPPFDNQDNFTDLNGNVFTGYHGYWPVNYNYVEPHQGTWQTYDQLVENAHQKNMKVVMDIPLNHVSYIHEWTKDPQKFNWFHHFGDIQDEKDQWQLENCNLSGLPDLAQENPEVSKTLINIAKDLIEKHKIDGFRLDAVKHVPRSFWKKFENEIRQYAGSDFFLLGEVLNGWDKYIVEYQKAGLKSLLDYPLFYSIKNSIALGLPMSELADKIEETNKMYDDPGEFGAFIDNHDTDRFLTMANGNIGKLKLALSLIYTINRIPVLYYGTEVGMEGKNQVTCSEKPENRKDLEWNKNSEVLEYTKKLAELRKSSPSLKEGGYLEMWRDESILTYTRMHEEEELIVCLNNSEKTQIREMPIRKESRLMKDNTVLTNLLNENEKFKVLSGKLKVTIPPFSALILKP